MNAIEAAEYMLALCDELEASGDVRAVEIRSVLSKPVRQHWDVDATKTKEHWLEVLGAGDDCGWWRAYAKFDGCCNVYRFFNVPEHEESRDEDHNDSIHICDLDEFIEKLTELRDLARKHFKNEFWADGREPKERD